MLYFNTNVGTTLASQGWAEQTGNRLHGAAHTGEGITDRNQLAALTLHGLFSHSPQTRQGHRTTIPGTSSLEPETPAGR